jgi:hypothetical protein
MPKQTNMNISRSSENTRSFMNESDDESKTDTTHNNTYYGDPLTRTATSFDKNRSCREIGAPAARKF